MPNSPFKTNATTQNELGILGYGCIYSCEWICLKNQMKNVALHVGTKNICEDVKTEKQSSEIICIYNLNL